MHIADSVEKLAEFTAGVAKQVRDELAEKRPAKVIIYLKRGCIQHIITDQEIEAYVIGDFNEEDSGKGGVADIGSLRVLVTRQKHMIAPKFANKVAGASGPTRDSE